MKYISLILLIVYSKLSFCQSKKVAIFKDTKIKIISSDIDKEPNRLPILTFTILNNTKENVFFNSIYLDLIQFKKNPTSSSSNNDFNSKVLTAIAGFDLTIPLEQNIYGYSLKSPIEITAKDAATIRIRLHSDFKNKHIIPSQLGSFKFTLTFVTYDNKGVKSDIILLGDTL